MLCSDSQIFQAVRIVPAMFPLQPPMLHLQTKLENKRMNAKSQTTYPNDLRWMINLHVNLVKTYSSFLLITRMPVSTVAFRQNKS